MWLIRAWLNDEIKNSKRFQEILFSCATCANCVEHCVFTFSEDLVNIFISAREEMVNEGIIPPPVRDYLKNIKINGNPYKEPAAERGKWAEGIPVETYSDQEFLFYVGCVGSYDERAKKIAKAVGGLLLKAGLSIGILGIRRIATETRSVPSEKQGFSSFLPNRISLHSGILALKKSLPSIPMRLMSLKMIIPVLAANSRSIIIPRSWHH